MDEMRSQLKEFEDSFLSETESRYRQANCEGVTPPESLYIRPRSEEQLIQVVQKIYELGLTFAVYSGGHNWGYGTALAVEPPAVYLDLSALCDILSFDEELGVAEVQPGVTQDVLARFLTARKSRWMAPMTGAGLRGNLTGNALEKGFGLNPVCDHFQAVISFRVLLPGGEVYQSTLLEAGAWKSDSVSKWKVGPCLEGLFAQSNFGIVLSMKFELAPKALSQNVLMTKASKSQLPELIDFVRELRWQFHGQVGAINISNKERLNITLRPLQNRKKGVIRHLNNLMIRALGLELADYQAIIPLPVQHPYSRAVHRLLKRKAERRGLRSHLMTERFNSKVLNIVSRLRFLSWEPLEVLLDRCRSLAEFLKMIDGTPSNFALKTAFVIKSRMSPEPDPAQEGVGLLWFAPILRLLPEDFVDFEALCEAILPEYGQRNYLTFTNFDQKLVEVTLPLYFEPSDEESKKSAYRCWEALYEASLGKGFSPYRFSVLHMNKPTIHAEVADSLKRAVKKAADPKNLFQRGRY